MKPTRSAAVPVLAFATLALAFVAARASAQEEPSPAPVTTAIAATPSPAAPASAAPRRYAPLIFVKPTPYKFGAAPASPPKRRKPAKTTRTAAAHRVASPLPTPSPTPSPAATATPTDVPSATPAATGATRRFRAKATPSPSPSSSTAASAAATIPPAIVPDGGPATPIPTQPPTPRPLAPSQPTIPDSLSDPNVRGIIARPIKQLSAIGWMQGTWSVTGVTNKVDGTTLPLSPTTYVFSPIMQNRWMFGADGKANDYIYLTFDPFARHWVALRFGNNPSYGMWTSEKGWIGNRIDFITNFSYVNGRQYRRRLTIIHKDARTFGIYETEQTPDGSFIPDDAYEFKKT